MVQFLPAAMILVTTEDMSPALSQIILQNQKDMAKQLLTPLRLIARMNF